jgi:hypothetical protein
VRGGRHGSIQYWEGGTAVSRIGHIKALSIRLLSQIDKWSKERSRYLLIICTLVSLGVGIYYQTDNVTYTPAAVREELAKKEDVYNLYNASAAAEWGDIPGWFVGPWNYPGVSYYRPITSVLFFVEYRAFGDNFTAYNRISCFLHGLNTALLFLFVCSLYRNWPRLRLCIGAVGIYYFATDGTAYFFAAPRCISWWPAQNDILSLTFGLASLVCFDQYLLKGNRWVLGATILSLVASISTKEMGFMLAPIMILLALYRKRVISFGVGIALAVTGGMWGYRRLVLTHPWEPDLFRSLIPRKAFLAWFGPVYWPVATGTYWHCVAAVAVLLIFGVAALRRAHIAIPTALSVLIVPIIAQIVGPDPSFAKIIVGQEVKELTAIIVFLFALYLFVRYIRSQPGMLAALSFALVNIPILQYYGGKHYHYWPSAFLALADAAFAGCLFVVGKAVWETRELSVVTKPNDACLDSDQALEIQAT